MSAETLFNVITAMGLPLWALFIFAPKSKATRAIVASVWPWIVYGVVYTVIAVVGTVTLDGFSLLDFFTLEGVKKVYAHDLTGIACWIHILAWDLFIARWILLDAPEGGYRLSPVLALTYGYGPAGLLAFLLTRRFLKGGHAP